MPFRLMTANLLHERCDPSEFARLLDEHTPDVVVAQELGPMCADIIGSAYPNHRLRPALGFLGRGIATRFDADFGEVDMPARPGTWARIDVDGINLSLAGVHLLNPIGHPVWASIRGRGRQLAALFRWLDALEPGIPVLVAGDFNATPWWPVYRQMSQRLDDVVGEHAARSNSSAERTWGWRPGWPRMLRIDHIFGSRVQATDVRVVPIPGSDHHAVIADLEITSS